MSSALLGPSDTATAKAAAPPHCGSAAWWRERATRTNAQRWCVPSVALATMLLLATAWGRGDGGGAGGGGGGGGGGGPGGGPVLAPCPPAGFGGLLRLPGDVRPTTYALRLGAQLAAPWRFGGSVVIGLNVTRPTACVLLHSANLTIAGGAASVTAEGWQTTGATTTATAAVFPQGGGGTMIAVSLPRLLQVGRAASLTLRFSGTVGDSMVGLYRSTYATATDTAKGGGGGGSGGGGGGGGGAGPAVAAADATGVMVSTQFEATAARRAFPCFDEPALKAAFDVTLLGVGAGVTALANMQEVGRVPSPAASLPYCDPLAYDDGLVGGGAGVGGGGSGGSSSSGSGSDGCEDVSFATSPRMSTYLVAVALGRMSSISAQTASGVTVTVYGRQAGGSGGGFDIAASGTYALAAAQSQLEFLGGYFSQPYPLVKLDLLAVPDFAAGAMENWGLVTFRETALLVAADGSASAASRQRVASVVSHELAHQWFGNLVTMDWWSALWLNEGFASYVQYIGVDHSNPALDYGSQFGGTLRAALAADAYAAQHALTVPVTDAAQIETLFDAIEYSKGASVIRMLATRYAVAHGSAGGADDDGGGRGGIGAFREGLNAYLTAHAYACATPADLFDAISAAIKARGGGGGGGPAVDVAADMKNWTDLPGFPVVTLSFDGGALPGAAAPAPMTARQRRFLLFPRTGDGDDDEATWWVDLTCAVPVSDGAWELQRFDMRSAATAPGQLVLPAAAAVGGSPWLKCNLNATGVYRVDYPDSVWKGLQEAIVLEQRDAAAAAKVAGEPKKRAKAPAKAAAPPPGTLSRAEVLRAPDRAALLDDIFALARSGHGNATRPLVFAAAVLPREASYEVWSAAAAQLRTVERLLWGVGGPQQGGDASCAPNFASWVSEQLVQPLLDARGWTSPDALLATEGNLSDTDTYLRVLLLELGSLSAASGVAGNATALFATMVSPAANPIPASLRDWVYGTTVRFGVEPAQGPGPWDTLKAFYEQLFADPLAQDPVEELRCLRALAAAPDTARLQLLLPMALDPARVRPQNALAVFAAVAANPAGLRVAWGYFSDHWRDLARQFGGSSGGAGAGLTSLLKTCAGRLLTADDAAAVQDLVIEMMGAGELRGGLLQAQQAILSVKANVRWVADQSWSSCDYLARATAPPRPHACPAPTGYSSCGACCAAVDMLIKSESFCKAPSSPLACLGLVEAMGGLGAGSVFASMLCEAMVYYYGDEATDACDKQQALVTQKLEDNVCRNMGWFSCN
jgi:aminopeptidase N